MEALIILLLIGGVVFFVLKSKASKDKKTEEPVNVVPKPPGFDPENRPHPGTDPLNRNPVDPISRD